MTGKIRKNIRIRGRSCYAPLIEIVFDICGSEECNKNCGLRVWRLK